MKSATQMSLEIRRKKKLASDPDESDAVDLSGIPEDATDIEVMKQESLTSDLGLDHNKPKPEEAVNHQSLMADSYSRQHEAETEDQDMELEHYADGGEIGSPGGPTSIRGKMAQSEDRIGAEGGPTSIKEKMDRDSAKTKHYQTLGEMRAMKKPNLPGGRNYADGGEVDEATMKRKARIAKMMGR